MSGYSPRRAVLDGKSHRGSIPAGLSCRLDCIAITLHMHMSCGAEDKGLKAGLEGRGAMVVGQRPAIVRKLWFLFLVCGH